MTGNAASNSTGQRSNADFWTNLATFGDSLESVLGNFYWGTTLANLFQGLEEDETSDASMWVGFGFSLLAVGTIYAHRKQNLYHQHGHSHGHAHGQPAIQSQPLNTPLLDEQAVPSTTVTIASDPAEEKHAHNHAHLSKWERVAIGLDVITHSGDVSGAITAAADLMSKHYFKNSFSFWQRASFQAVSTVIGLGAGIANARNCKDSMEKLNTAACQDNPRPSS